MGLRGHILWIESWSGDDRTTTDIPVEGSAVFLLVVIADIVLLATSDRFATVPRELVRWIGGAFIALVALCVVMFVVLDGLINLIGPAMASFRGKSVRIPTSSFVSVGVAALGLGALLGTGPVIGGPADFAADAVLLIVARLVWRGHDRPGRWPAGRRLLAAGPAIAGCSGAVIGVLLLQTS
jgi:hypothetical protein